MTAPVFVVDGVPAKGPYVLEGPEGRHAVSVRRLHAGEDVVLTDGRGTGARPWWWPPRARTGSSSR